jgi:hypothetical protein
MADPWVLLAASQAPYYANPDGMWTVIRTYLYAKYLFEHTCLLDKHWGSGMPTTYQVEVDGPGASASGTRRGRPAPHPGRWS